MARRHGRPAWSTSAAAGVAAAITLAFAAYTVAAVTGLDATQAAGSARRPCWDSTATASGWSRW